MAMHNNPNLNTQQLAEKAAQIRKQRRRAEPTDSNLPAFKYNLNNQEEEMPPDNIEHSLQEEDGPSHSPQDQEKIIPSKKVKQNIFEYLSRRYEKITQPGLGMRQRIRLIPLFGYAIAWCNALLRLPVTRHHGAVTLLHLQEKIDSLQSEIILHQQHILQLESSKLESLKLESLKLAVRLDRYDALDIGTRLMQLDRLQIARQLKSVNLMMRTGLQKEDALIARINMLEQSNVCTSLARNISSADQPDTFKSVISDNDFNQDQFYIEFEALFRGSREDIKQRLKVYLPYLSHIIDLPKNNRPMVIDVGCGRGEWLELMDELEIPAIGVDMNASMVNACLQDGFVARHADAIAYLRELPQGSVGAVTGFHIIEHLPFESLIALFDAAQHALCPGGVIIFETPNPENLRVGACSFYSDPTHLHPIVPQVAEFMVIQRGFAQAEILRLHPYPDDHQLHGGSEVEAVINKTLFGPQDYAVIGRK